MAAVRLLVDTDVLIDYFNTGLHAAVLDGRSCRIYYSIVTRKELLAKRGLRDSERRSIIEELRRFRLIPLTPAIAARYVLVRQRHRWLEREDALIAATAMVKRMPLLTRDRRHFGRVEGLDLFEGG